MRPLLLLICLLMLTMVLTVGAMLIGHSQPNDAAHNPLMRVGFSTCGNSICVFGIIPGQTRWDEARTLLDAAGVMYAEARFNPISTYTITNAQGTLFIQSSDGIGRVGIITWQADPTLYRLEYAWLLANFGTPCTHSDKQQANFKNLSVRFYNTHRYFDLHAPIWLAVLYSDVVLGSGCDTLQP